MLRLSGLRKTFGDTVAVDGLSLEVERGEVFGFLGPNGAGKTTTIHMTVGLLRPDAGEVDIGGRGSPALPAVRRQVGVAPQALALYDELTARENLQFFGGLYQLRGAALRKRVDELLETIGLTERAKDRLQTFSGGMKRRLNYAVALLHDPPVVLLDEPTAGVDPQSRNKLFDLVRQLRDEGRTVVYTTHYMEEAQRLCDRVAIIDHGKLLALDKVDALIDAHGGKSVVRVGDTRIETDDPTAELRRLLDADGDAHDIRVERPDLEAVFLRLTGRSLRDA